jgi:superfamily II DNA helicase RecQ
VVVVSPLLSLIDDQVRHARSMHIRAAAAKGGKDFGWHSMAMEGPLLVYITPEQVGMRHDLVQRTHMQEVMHRAQAGHVLAIFLDEAHHVPHSANYRADYDVDSVVALRRLPELKNVIFGGMTATPSVRTIAAVPRALGHADADADGLTVVRQEDGLARTNIYRSFVELNALADVDEQVKTIINDARGARRMMIFCHSPRDVMDVTRSVRTFFSGHLTCAGVWSPSNPAPGSGPRGSPIKASQVASDIQRFRDAKVNVLVTTSYLAEGMDFTGVQYVAVLGLPPRIVPDYVQMEGRIRGTGSATIFHRLGPTRDQLRLENLGKGHWCPRSKAKPPSAKVGFNMFLKPHDPDVAKLMREGIQETYRFAKAAQGGTCLHLLVQDALGEDRSSGNCQQCSVCGPPRSEEGDDQSDAIGGATLVAPKFHHPAMTDAVCALCTAVDLNSHMDGHATRRDVALCLAGPSGHWTRLSWLEGGWRAAPSRPGWPQPAAQTSCA